MSPEEDLVSRADDGILCRKTECSGDKGQAKKHPCPLQVVLPPQDDGSGSRALTHGQTWADAEGTRQPRGWAGGLTPGPGPPAHPRALTPQTPSRPRTGQLPGDGSAHRETGQVSQGTAVRSAGLGAWRRPSRIDEEGKAKRVLKGGAERRREHWWRPPGEGQGGNRFALCLGVR